MARYIGAASGAALGFIYGNAPGAYAGGSFGYAAGVGYDARQIRRTRSIIILY